MFLSKRLCIKISLTAFALVAVWMFIAWHLPMTQVSQGLSDMAIGAGVGVALTTLTIATRPKSASLRDNKRTMSSVEHQNIAEQKNDE